MKAIAIHILFFFLVQHCNAQYFYTCDYLPKPCLDGDPITITDSISLTTLDHRIHDSISRSNDTIVLHLCYLRPGGPQGGHQFQEKTSIGKLPVGKYVVKIEGVINQFGVCDSTPNFFNTIYFPLEVLAIPNTVSEAYFSNIHLNSMLINENILISSIPPKSILVVYDIQGRQQYQKENVSGDVTINSSGWSKGIYIVALEVNNERKRWKVLKE